MDKTPTPSKEGLETTSCVSHKSSSTYFTFFEDFIDVAQKAKSPHALKLAGFWRVMEVLTTKKIALNAHFIPETNEWVEVAYSTMEQFSLGILKRSSFQVAAEESKRLGFSVDKEEERTTRNGKRQVFKTYLFNYRAMNLALQQGILPPPVENNSPLLKKRKKKTPVENNTPPVENNSPPVLSTTAPPVENNWNNIIVIEKKENSKRVCEETSLSVASDDAHSPSLLEICETIVPTEENTPGESENDSHSYSQQPTEPDPQPEKKPVRRTKKPANVTDLPKIPAPIMPTAEDAWTPETILQVFEARLGRRYPNGAKRASDRVRDVELASCQGLYEMSDLWGPDTLKNAKRLDRLINQLETRHNKWWLNTNGRVMPHNLVEKDRAHQMLDELRRERAAKKKEEQGQSPDGGPKKVGNLAYFSADQLGA